MRYGGVAVIAAACLIVGGFIGFFLSALLSMSKVSAAETATRNVDMLEQQLAQAGARIGELEEENARLRHRLDVLGEWREADRKGGVGS